MSSIPHLVRKNDGRLQQEAADTCPLCEQPIAAEQRAEIWGRISARRHEQETARDAEVKRQIGEAVKSATAAQTQEHAAVIIQFQEQLRDKDVQSKKREQEVRQQALREAGKQHERQVAEAQAKQVDAEKQAKALAKQLVLSKDAHTKELEQVVARETAKLRGILAKDKDDALNKAAAKHFDEKQKLQAKLQEAQRQLDKERADQLGEGQEVDLYNELKQAFPQDKITRIAKGEPGADIRQEIVDRGKVCGTILYESKNSMQWRRSYAAKLRKDQIAEKADHAVLASVKFPEGSRELTIVDGVIIINPRRVVTLARLLRDSSIQIHKLHLSAEQSTGKRDELYKFITSPRCEQMLGHQDELTGALLELEKTEHRQHEKIWKERGVTLKQLEKAQAEFRGEISFVVEG